MEYQWSQMTWEDKITLVARRIFGMELENVSRQKCTLVNGDRRDLCGPPSDYIGDLEAAVWAAEEAISRFQLPAVWELSRSRADGKLYRAVIREERPFGPYIQVFGHAEMESAAESLVLAALRATGLRVLY